MIFGASPADNASRPADATTNPALVSSLLEKCRVAFQASPDGIGDDRGYRWAHGITGYSMFNTIQTPNDALYRFGVCRLDGGPNDYPDDGFVYGASSSHPGGVNVLMGDGSVKFIKDGINRMTWWSLGTRSGGEVVNAGGY
jgi:prepilin-type processing-associated H-X9-DG protein